MEGPCSCVLYCMASHGEVGGSAAGSGTVPPHQHHHPHAQPRGIPPRLHAHEPGAIHPIKTHGRHCTPAHEHNAPSVPVKYHVTVPSCVCVACMMLLYQDRHRKICTSQDAGDARDSARRTLAVAALSIPLGTVVSIAVCCVARGWSGDLSPETHSTAVTMQGVLRALIRELGGFNLVSIRYEAIPYFSIAPSI